MQANLSSRRPSPTHLQCIGTALLLLLLTAGAVQAHKIVTLRRNDDTAVPRLLPIATGTDHLSFDPAALDFGAVSPGQSVARSVTVTNVSADELSVTVTPPLGFSVSVSSFTLAVGASRSMSVTFSPQGGEDPAPLSFDVQHAGVGSGHQEPLDLTFVTPPRLQFDIPAFGEVDVAGLDFGLVSTKTAGPDSPAIEVKITNAGGTTAQDVTVVIPGPGRSDANVICHEGLATAGLCFSKKEGTSLIGVQTLGDLAPGATVSTQWRIEPAAAGAVDKTFAVQIANATDQTLTVSGEVIGFVIPDLVATLEGLFRADESTTPGTKAFGETVDPLEEDPLGTFRPVSFDARTVFSVGEIDTVDLRAGNLTVVVPIGGTQVVRGPLAYELQAVFNGSIWYRRTLGELAVDESRERARPRAGEYLDPGFNTGAGWSFHLGRLLPPFQFDGLTVDANTCNNDPLGFEKSVDTGPRFVYIDPNGTHHEFWRKLHGEETDASGSYSTNVIQYTRDGSFLRLVKDGSNVRWVEEPSGIRRKFVFQTNPHPTLPDSWRLESIEDPYGNKLTITYGTNVWHLDTPWNRVSVHFNSWTGRTSSDPMVVDKIVFPGFNGGADRVYDFQYTDLTLQRPDRFTGAGSSDFYDLLATICPNLDLGIPTQRLDRILLPDGSSYSFNYLTPVDARLQMRQVSLPTGGKIRYEYTKVWDSPPDCENRSASFPTLGVSRRTVFDADGTTRLEDRRFLRQTRRTNDVPDLICQAVNPNDNSNSLPPWSEQWVVVWNQLQTATTSAEAHPNGLSSASVHYFNIFPYIDCGPVKRDAQGNALPGLPGCSQNTAGTRWVLDSGRSNIERNLKISRDPGPMPGGGSSVDPFLGQLHRSEELFSCPFDLVAGGGTPGIGRTETVTGDTVGDDVPGFLAFCTPKQTTYAAYEVERSGTGCKLSGPRCLRDSRLKDSRTVFHDDGGRWVRTTRSDFDGLGHFRSTVTRSNFQKTGGPNTSATLVQESFQNFNPGVGTLVLQPNHRVQTDITPPTAWLLDIWNYRWDREGGDVRGGEAVFHATQGHLRYERTWNKTGALATGPANFGSNRTTTDLVVKNAVDAQGELEEQHFFGANTYSRGTPMPTGSGWMNDANWNNSWQDYAIDYVYQAGRVAQKRVVGDSVFEIRRTVDAGTGWTKTETLDTGEVLTYAYDPMGRIEWVQSGTTASRSFGYAQANDDRWTLTSRVHPKGTGPATASPAILREYIARFDGLGRIRQETFPRYNDNPAGTRRRVTRDIVYHSSGLMASVEALDNATRATRLDFDFRGRPVRRIEPDNTSKTAWVHRGVRETDIQTCVRTGIASSGICAGTGNQRVTVTRERDWKRRVVRVKSPQGFNTNFAYDPLDRQIRATRSHGAITQTRSWGYNGLGFQTSENIPERATTTLSNFNTRGQARTAVEGGRVTARTYDSLGRLRSLAVGGDTVKSFTYESCPFGSCNNTSSSNGRLVEAVRCNDRGAGESGVRISGVDVAGSWKVTSTFGHDAAGRVQSRTTDVVFLDTAGNEVSGTTSFDQGWSYDDLGNVTALTYPTCTHISGPADCKTAQSINYGYGQGFFLTQVVGGTLGATLTYHPSGLVNQVAHSGGGGTDLYGVAGGMPRIASIDLANGTFDRLNLGAVAYDGAGNIRSIGTDTFVYDRNSRLVSASVQGTSFSYQYDNFDNITSLGTVDQSNNQLGGIGWVYDAFGNLDLAAGHDLVYDEVDKVAAIHEPGGISQLGIYDHDDLRVMTFRQDDPQGQITWTLRDGLRVLREFVGNGPGVIRNKDYVYAGARLISSKSYTDGAVRHYHEDQVGSSRLTTLGGLGGTVHYGPFGEEEFPNDVSGERAVGFQGHENDSLTTYMRGRTYLHSAGRFVQVDPGRDDSSWSPYAFVGNNPLGFSDPTGLESAQIILDLDNRALLEGKLTQEEFRERVRARGMGALIGLQIVTAVTGAPLVVEIALEAVSVAPDLLDQRMIGQVQADIDSAAVGETTVLGDDMRVVRQGTTGNATNIVSDGTEWSLRNQAAFNAELATEPGATLSVGGRGGGSAPGSPFTRGELSSSLSNPERVTVDASRARKTTRAKRFFKVLKWIF